MKIRTLIIAAMLTIVAFFTTTASAKEVDRALAANPSAVLSEINGMNLPALSDQEAGKIRGEFAPVLYYYAVVYGVPVSILAAYFGSRTVIPLSEVVKVVWSWNNGGGTGGGGSW